MNNMKKPRIRFKGFTDDWEQRKLSDITNVYDGVHQTPDYQESGIMFLSVENIATLKSNKYISQEAFERDYKNYPEKGDILMTRIGDVGTPNVVETTEKVAFYVSLALLKPKNVDSYFLCNAICSPEFQRNLKNRTLVTAIPQKINKDEIGKVEFLMPQNTSEQKAIGAYFKNLDHLITLHQSKAESWKNKKNQLSTISWEQRKLGDLMDVGSVKRVHQSDWRDSGVRFLRARDVVADFNNEEPDDYLYIDQKMYEEYSAQSGKVQQGDLLVTGVGTIGIPMLIKSEKPLYFKDGNIIWFKNKNAIDGQFFYYSFISKGIQDFIKESAGIGTVGTYTIDSGKKTPINLPTSIEEQKKIGAFLESIDNVITLHHRKLNS